MDSPIRAMISEAPTPVTVYRTATTAYDTEAEFLLAGNDSGTATVGLFDHGTATGESGVNDVASITLNVEAIDPTAVPGDIQIGIFGKMYQVAALQRRVFAGNQDGWTVFLSE